MIGMNLKYLRKKYGYSQEDLAERLEVSRQSVAKWENGLGLPSDESLKILAEYFNIGIGELMPDKANAETLVSKNRTIVQQKKVIIGLAIGCGVGLFVLGYVFIEPLRDSIEQLAIGTLLTILGIFNMKGNIASIHWYNRRKVTKENQKPYCLCMGLGTLIIGVGMIASGVIQVFAGIEVGAIFIAVSVVIGLILMLYAQFKYNRGLF